MLALKKIGYSVFLAINVTTTYAGNFPRGCEVTGFGYNGPLLSLNDRGDQAYYLVQNRSTQKIELQHVETKEVFMSPPLIARLDANNWAAFASDVSNQLFQCFYIQNNNTNNANNEKVDCRDVLDICQYPRVKFALSNMGNYWVSINKSQQDVIQDSTAKGIYLRW